MNNYDKFRNEIKNALKESCCKKSKSGDSVSYNWSFAPAIVACQLACKVANEANSTKAPEDFSKIVRFEFNKLKEEVLSERGEGWEHVRTRFSYAISDVGAKKIATDRWQNECIPLKEQEQALMVMLDKLGKQVDKTQEDASRRRKKMNAIIMRLDFVRKEIKSQEELQTVVSEEMLQELKVQIAQKQLDAAASK